MSGYLEIDRDAMTLIERCIFDRNFPEPISDNQAEMMLHALGADHRKYKTYRGCKIFHAYRNYFDAGGLDADGWDDLVSNGYARKAGTYHVSVRGIRALEFLTHCRIWDDYENAADCRGVVLDELMKDNVFCGYGCWLPTSSSDLSLRLAIPRPLVLETLRELEKDGLAKRDYFGEKTDEGYVRCKHGWILTLAAQEKFSERLAELRAEEYRRLDEMVSKGAENV